jgi:hypothetical protein
MQSGEHSLAVRTPRFGVALDAGVFEALPDEAGLVQDADTVWMGVAARDALLEPISPSATESPERPTALVGSTLSGKSRPGGPEVAGR